jgi:hypothetical protein
MHLDAMLTDADESCSIELLVRQKMDNDPFHPWGWSPARRARQAEAIRRWRPWVQSTGPRTAEGRAISSRNAAMSNSIRQQLLSLGAEIKQVMKIVKQLEAKRKRRQA